MEALQSERDQTLAEVQDTRAAILKAQADLERQHLHIDKMEDPMGRYRKYTVTCQFPCLLVSSLVYLSAP